MKKLNVQEQKETDKLFATSTDALKSLYSSKIKPLEQLTKFGDFFSPTLTDADIAAKPMILLLGQYSTGKTSFINYLLEKPFVGSNVAVEPSTDRFNAVMHGTDDRILPGNIVCVQSQDYPFKGLEKFGNGFMGRFQCSLSNAPILEKVSFIDTPGVLNIITHGGNEGKKVGRSYDFPQIVEWFAERSDMILLLFDAHKLDISDEYREAITKLKGHDEKIRIVLNKADNINAQQLLRVYGGLMWSLGRVITTPEVKKVTIGSFWSGPLQNKETENLLYSEMVDLIKDILLLPKNGAIRKVNDLVKRSRLVKVHALILNHLRSEMPVFGKEKKQAELIANLDKEFQKISLISRIPMGDFPDVDHYRTVLKVHDFTKFPKINEKMLAQLNEVLAVDFPNLLSRFPIDGTHKPSAYELNPFALDEVDENVRWTLFENVDISAFAPLFNSLNPIDGKVQGQVAKGPLFQSGLPNNVLAHIWRLSDVDRDGKMDIEEFALAMHLVNVKLKGYELPETLPTTLIPFSKRGGMFGSNPNSSSYQTILSQPQQQQQQYQQQFINNYEQQQQQQQQ
ncbi:hypothetical protein ACTFIW_005845 [Dictyostelium discoideum]